jgi:alpha-tubulin suppressor-like RCC1 family protein
MWGDGINGRLGNGTYNISYSSPIQIGTLTNWKSVSADSSSTVAMKTDRSLWAWGNNSLGQLGLSNVKYYSSPVQIGSLTNWSQITVNGAIMFILN